MTKKIQKQSKELSLSSILLGVYILSVVLSAIALFLIVIDNKINGGNIYLMYLTGTLFGSLVSLPSFLFSVFYIFKLIYSNLVSNKSTKEEPPVSFFVILIIFSLFLGGVSFITNKALVNTVLDYSYLQSPHKITLFNTRLHSRSIGRGSFPGKRYEVYGYDENGSLHDFFLPDGYKISVEFSKIDLYYLPHSKMVIDFNIIE